MQFIRASQDLTVTKLVLKLHSFVKSYFVRSWASVSKRVAPMTDNFFLIRGTDPI